MPPEVNTHTGDSGLMSRFLGGGRERGRVGGGGRGRGRRW